MADARSEGLRAAADYLAGVMRRVARVRTQRTADAVHVSYEGDEAVVQGGRPEGAYGWEPIQGAMFDDNSRHPLFGNKRHWYHQGEWPITETTVRLGADYAAEEYADAAVDLMLKEHGVIE